jgi:hypothetical protein
MLNSYVIVPAEATGANKTHNKTGVISVVAICEERVISFSFSPFWDTSSYSYALPYASAYRASIFAGILREGRTRPKAIRLIN